MLGVSLRRVLALGCAAAAALGLASVWRLHSTRRAVAESNLAQQLSREHRLGEALTHFATAATLEPSAENLANLGRAQLLAGALEPAIEALARAVALSPSLPRAQLARAARFAEAEPALERALALDAADTTARRALARVEVRRGEALVAEGQLEPALARFQRATQLDPEFQAAQQDLVETAVRLRGPTDGAPRARSTMPEVSAGRSEGASHDEGRAAGSL
jgi:tetratricopeptide (TPR) repeat protein